MWIAFEVDKETFPNTEDPHITLAYCGENYVPADVEFVNYTVSKLGKFFGPVEVWGEELQVWHDKYLVLPILVPEQVKLLRQLLVNSLFKNDVWFSNKYSWNPHITLGKKDMYNTAPYGAKSKRLFVHSRLGREYHDLIGE
jgi:2'-5' RNA ligase